MKIPLVHITDLYHPPQDPDDHFDLATVMALPEFELLGVILDATDKFLKGAPDGYDIPRDPGFVPVIQLGYLTGRAIPVAVGPLNPLQHPADAVRDRAVLDQSGTELLLNILRATDEPVVISVVCSARVVAAAFNRDPELMRCKTKAIVLNAGSSAATQDEWNVDLDRAAYIGLWRSGLPIHWYPCTTERGPFDEDHHHGTYWQSSHEDLLRDVPPKLAAWFCYAFTGDGRGDIVRALHEQKMGSIWEHVKTAKRNLWSTASLVMAAGRVLARTPTGWRFVPNAEAQAFEEWPFALEPITVRISDDGQVNWQLTSEPTVHKLFRRQPGREYSRAMGEALNALLRSMICSA